MSNEAYLADLYGPLAPHSEYRPGDSIRYHLAGETSEHSGTVLWVCEPGTYDRLKIDLRYIVQRDTPPGWPDVVFPSDVLT